MVFGSLKTPDDSTGASLGRWFRGISTMTVGASTSRRQITVPFFCGWESPLLVRARLGVRSRDAISMDHSFSASFPGSLGAHPSLSKLHLKTTPWSLSLILDSEARSGQYLTDLCFSTKAAVHRHSHSPGPQCRVESCSLCSGMCHGAGLACFQ